MLRRTLLTLFLFAGALCPANGPQLVSAVDSIGLTVSDLDRSVDFYTSVLSFQKVSEFEAGGPELEHLQGVLRVAPAHRPIASRR